MSSRDDWVPLAAGVVVGAGLLALLYKMLSGHAAYSSKSHNYGADTFVCTCAKGGPALSRDLMIFSAEELERRRSRTHPIPALQSEASSLCGWSGALASLPTPGGWAKAWVPIIGTVTLSLFAVYYKFKDKIKAMLWDTDPCAGFITKAKPVPPKKTENCGCD